MYLATCRGSKAALTSTMRAFTTLDAAINYCSKVFSSYAPSWRIYEVTPDSGQTMKRISHKKIQAYLEGVVKVV